jgi:transposase-like protein
LGMKSNLTEYRTMTQKRVNKGTKEIQAMMAGDADFLRPLVGSVIQEFLEAEMATAIGAEKGERIEGRLSYRSGYYPRSLITRVGKLELRVPQDRNGRFSTEIFERDQRREKALVAALTEMYIQGVSTRKVKAISEELGGHSFSASAISGFNKKLDEELGRFARRELDCEYPDLILDARYEKERENAVIRSRAVFVAIGIDWEGRRQVLGVEMANRESSTSWKDFLLGLKTRGLRGVIFVGRDDHPGLKRAIMEVLPEAYWQRCDVHFLRNALDYLPRKGGRRLPCRAAMALRPARRRRSPQRLGGLAAAMAAKARRVRAGEVSKALRLGGREYRRDPHLLSVTPGASPTS